MSQAGLISVSSSVLPPEVPLQFTTDAGVAVPAANNLNVFGVVNAAGTDPFSTSGATDTVTINIQTSQAIAASDATKIGLASFDSASFDVDANGFVQLNGGGIAASSFDVQASTAPGTDPVVPTAAGVVTVNGAAVANHSVVLETRSRAANAYNLEVQYGTSTLATDATKSGVVHFNVAQFTVDANGFVSTSATGVANTITGNTGGALPPTAGNWTIITANSTVKFAGAASTLTQDFALGNLVLGSSLPSITSANNNVGLGNTVLASITSGQTNVAIGTNAGNTLTSATANTLVGHNAGSSITTGGSNTAIGTSALGNFTTGAANAGSNTGVGNNTLGNLSTGIHNTAVGDGSSAIITFGSHNISLGYFAGRTHTGADSSNIDIGNVGVLGESNVIRIGTQGTGNGQQSQTHIAGVINTVSGRVVKVTTPGAYPYTTLTTDYVILVDTSAARTINLIAAPVTGTTYRIKDNVGSAAANNITITPAAGNIDGAASYVINNNYGAVDVVYNGTQWNKF